MADGDPLIFFHFHGLKRIAPWLYDPDWATFGVTPSTVLRRQIYLPYLRALCDASRLFPQLSGVVPPSGIGSIRRESPRVSLPRRVARRIRALVAAGKALLAGRYLVLFGSCRKAG